MKLGEKDPPQNVRDTAVPKSDAAAGVGHLRELRVLIADDHEMVRGGLRKLVEAQPGWKVVGEALDGREAVRKAQQLKPDVVVLDVSMPRLNGLEATRQIVKALPHTPVLILTMHDSERMVHDVLSAGARGYVLKSDASRDLVKALEALAEKRTFFTSKVAEMVLAGYVKSHADGGDSADKTRLTPREREIVQLLAEGKSTKEVGVALGVSERTADTHRANLMRKLDLHTIADLVHYAIRNKIIEP